MLLLRYIVTAGVRVWFLAGAEAARVLVWLVRWMHCLDGCSSYHLDTRRLA